MDLKEVLKILIDKLQAQNIDFVLIGGLALSTMNIFRFTKDLDFLVHEASKEKTHAVMTDLGYGTGSGIFQTFRKGKPSG